MTIRLLIDATHSEETRVAVTDDTQLREYDYENKIRRQLKGNIFLAKVTRVEPSLQAAFVDYGGNRHGFLPFSEIHPDYFRIPVEDRQALQAELAEEAEKQRIREEEEDSDDSDNNDVDDDDDDDVDDEDDDNIGNRKQDANGADGNKSSSDNNDNENGNGKSNNRGRRGRRGRFQRARGSNNKGRGRGKAARSKNVEVVGGDDEASVARPNLRKKYKIQEVVKRGQIMLVQISKEERGNKGAAVTTYISLAGRYCVLMPNSPRAGGVSRKIPSFKERKRMRGILDSLKISDGMSVILRTAGVGRTKAEIKRDYDYLMRLWSNIREKTLQSSAPEEVHEEANLIKRAIRDLYTRDIEEVLVAGKDGYKEAKDFMKMMIPSHAKRVKHYEDERIPLFHRYQIESQIAAIGDPSVSMKSGGYLVINPTEALVSVDVNSGRATKERHIEETALHTNLEAADEVARQLRLRDLGGLVVIDFIDMEDRRNNRKVENHMREALSKDRARVQVGRISNFGLMELSRQRLNPSLTESQFRQCHHCSGTGNVRSLESTTLNLLRELEEEGIRDRANNVEVQVTNEVALYILNNKRHHMADIEDRYDLKVTITVNDDIAAGEYKMEPIKSGSSDEDAQPDDKGNRRHQSKSGDDRNSGRKRSRRGGRDRNNHQKDDDKPQDQDQKAETQSKAKDSSDDSKKKTNKQSSSKYARKDDKKLKKQDEKSQDDAPKKRGRPKKSESKSEDDKNKKKASKANGHDKTESSQDTAQSSDNDNADKTVKETKKSAKVNKPQKSHPDENVTIIPDDTKKTAGKSAGRKGWWSR